MGKRNQGRIQKFGKRGGCAYSINKFVLAITLLFIDRFSRFKFLQNAENVRNSVIFKEIRGGYRNFVKVAGAPSINKFVLAIILLYIDRFS
jgi:hypothetical protein